MSKYINVEVNTDVDVYIGDVWEQIDDDELRGEVIRRKLSARVNPVSYTHLTLPTTPYV